jgi:hypothetical protein
MKMGDLEAVPTEMLIEALEVSGRYPVPELIRAIWEREDEARPLLLELFRQAYHDDWSDEDDPRWYRFVHAGKFLLAWREEAAIPIFADMYMDDEVVDMCEWFEKEPANFGPAAIPHFSRVAQMDTGGEWHYGRALSLGILTAIGLRHLESREEVLGQLRTFLPPLSEIPRLADEDYDETWGVVASNLGTMRDEESRERVLALFEADMIDLSYIDREDYLRQMNAREPAEPDPPYDLLEYYSNWYDSHQRREKRLEAERRRQAKQPVVRPAQPRSGPKIGRNEPCPCGSGKKYKKCHGRPGQH